MLIFMLISRWIHNDFDHHPYNYLEFLGFLSTGKLLSVTSIHSVCMVNDTPGSNANIQMFPPVTIETKIRCVCVLQVLYIYIYIYTLVCSCAYTCTEQCGNRWWDEFDSQVHQILQPLSQCLSQFRSLFSVESAEIGSNGYFAKKYMFFVFCSIITIIMIIITIIMFSPNLKLRTIWNSLHIQSKLYLARILFCRTTSSQCHNRGSEYLSWPCPSS